MNEVCVFDVTVQVANFVSLAQRSVIVFKDGSIQLMVKDELSFWQVYKEDEKNIAPSNSYLRVYT